MTNALTYSKYLLVVIQALISSIWAGFNGVGRFFPAFSIGGSATALRDTCDVDSD